MPHSRCTFRVYSWGTSVVRADSQGGSSAARSGDREINPDGERQCLARFHSALSQSGIDEGRRIRVLARTARA
jgi:hypothetical protein